MAALDVLLLDPEVEYLMALAGYIEEENPGRFRVNTFSNKNSLDVFLQQRKAPPDAILYNAVFDDLVRSSFGSGRACLCLDDGNTPVPGDVYAVSKYTMAGDIVREMLVQCEKAGIAGDSASDRGRQACLSAMISPSGGSGKTTVALAVCMTLAEKGAKTLYLNMESISSVPAFFTISTHSSITNVLFGVREGFAGLSSRIRSSVATDDDTSIFYFSPPENCTELDGVSVEEVRDMISCIKTCGLFDAAVIDLPAGLSTKTSAVLETCDLLFCVVTPRPVCKVRTSIFTEEMDRVCRMRKTGFTDKSRLIENMQPIGQWEGHQTNLNAPVINGPYYLPYDPVLEKSADLRGIRNARAFYNAAAQISDTIGFKASKQSKQSKPWI